MRARLLRKLLESRLRGNDRLASSGPNHVVQQNSHRCSVSGLHRRKSSAGGESIVLLPATTRTKADLLSGQPDTARAHEQILLPQTVCRWRSWSPQVQLLYSSRLPASAEIKLDSVCFQHGIGDLASASGNSGPCKRASGQGHFRAIPGFRNFTTGTPVQMVEMKRSSGFSIFVST